MEDFEQELELINKKLDSLEFQIAMSQEALESLEIRLRLLNAELDFDLEGPPNV
jgi:hypothetical protein